MEPRITVKAVPLCEWLASQAHRQVFQTTTRAQMNARLRHQAGLCQSLLREIQFCPDTPYVHAKCVLGFTFVWGNSASVCLCACVVARGASSHPGAGVSVCVSVFARLPSSERRTRSCQERRLLPTFTACLKEPNARLCETFRCKPVMLR